MFERDQAVRDLDQPRKKLNQKKEGVSKDSLRNSSAPVLEIEPQRELNLAHRCAIFDVVDDPAA